MTSRLPSSQSFPPTHPSFNAEETTPTSPAGFPSISPASIHPLARPAAHRQSSHSVRWSPPGPLDTTLARPAHGLPARLPQFIDQSIPKQPYASKYNLTRPTLQPPSASSRPQIRPSTVPNTARQQTTGSVRTIMGLDHTELPPRPPTPDLTRPLPGSSTQPAYHPLTPRPTRPDQDRPRPHDQTPTLLSSPAHLRAQAHPRFHQVFIIHAPLAR